MTAALTFIRCDKAKTPKAKRIALFQPNYPMATVNGNYPAYAGFHACNKNNMYWVFFSSKTWKRQIMLSELQNDFLKKQNTKYFLRSKAFIY